MTRRAVFVYVGRFAPMDDVFERFLSLAKRELAADDVRLLAADETPPEAPNVVVTRLRNGRHVVASFGEEPKDAGALRRRLAMLAGTFSDALEFPTSERTKARPPVVTSLHDELKALASRARAFDVVVIDADSPVVWGCASVDVRPRVRADLVLRDVSDSELSSSVEDDDPSAPSVTLRAVPPATGGPVLYDVSAKESVFAPRPPRPRESAIVVSPRTPGLKAETPDVKIPRDLGVLDVRFDEKPEVDASSDEGEASRDARAADEAREDDVVDDEVAEDAGDESNEPELTRRAIAAIRKLPARDLLHKGKHLRHVSREDACYLVLSFSSIYLLCLVFDGEFDELRAERAAQEALPRIERLVLALPPLDPEPQPMGGVVALRRPRHR